MNQDLKIIKKKYGEKMAHFCRDYFSTLLETDGLLLKLMLENFEPNHSLYEDIAEQGKEINFKNYLYSLVDVEKNKKIKVIKTPEYLLSDAGYDLYECKCEEDIQKFKKYYAKGEELCTFNGGRLNRCHVFFAVKKNVSQIKREDYPNPERQDEYGTSVISIQFTRDASHTLSIKNRYNHHVNNPDSTYSNNLDNIISGLTESFGEYYGLVQQNPNNNFELDGYVKANDGKYYKYNCEIGNVYYCPNNIIIDNFEVKRYDKEKYIVFDYFILDLVKKEVIVYDKRVKDAFPDTISNIQKIEIKRKEEEKEIIISLKDNKIVITLNKENQMIKLDYPELEQVEDNFLAYNKHLKVLKMANLQKGGSCFLGDNVLLQELDLPNLQEIGFGFLFYNKFLRKLNLPLLKKVGGFFLSHNEFLQEVSLPSLEEVGDRFLESVKLIEKLNFPKLQKVGNNFIQYNEVLKELSLPSLRKVGNYFLIYNTAIEEVDLPLLEEVGDEFLYYNQFLKKLDLPHLKKVGDSFLFHNNSIEKLYLPFLKKVGNDFFDCNKTIQEVYLPSLEIIGNDFLARNEIIQKVYLPSLEIVGYHFLWSHPAFTKEDFIPKAKR